MARNLRSHTSRLCRRVAFGGCRDNQAGCGTRGTLSGAEMTKETKRAFDDRFAREMTETADGMRRVGVMDEAAHKLTMRDLKRAPPDETVMPNYNRLRNQAVAGTCEDEPSRFCAVSP